MSSSATPSGAPLSPTTFARTTWPPDFDEHFGVGVVEADLAADDVAGRERGDGQQVRELGQLREIDTRRRRQHLDGAAAAPLAT